MILMDFFNPGDEQRCQAKKIIFSGQMFLEHVRVTGCIDLLFDVAKMKADRGDAPVLAV